MGHYRCDFACHRCGELSYVCNCPSLLPPDNRTEKQKLQDFEKLLMNAYRKAVDEMLISPQPTMPQPETNCPKPEFFEDSFGLVAGTLPSSKLSAHDQVTRDEFDQEAM